jgi:hypothetical protein
LRKPLLLLQVINPVVDEETTKYEASEQKYSLHTICSPWRKFTTTLDSGGPWTVTNGCVFTTKLSISAAAIIVIGSIVIPDSHWF